MRSFHAGRCWMIIARGPRGAGGYKKCPLEPLLELAVLLLGTLFFIPAQFRGERLLMIEDAAKIVRSRMSKEVSLKRKISNITKYNLKMNIHISTSRRSRLPGTLVPDYGASFEMNWNIVPDGPLERLEHHAHDLEHCSRHVPVPDCTLTSLSVDTILLQPTFWKCDRLFPINEY